ncbi:MAG: DUF2200 domain-containing protein [Cellulomonadaceae bacterium]|nr:DUF2200 domain-containing protein [Cellulomonadaceae bacterium]
MATPSPSAVAKAEAQVRKITFASVYPLYIRKIEAKGRTVDELHQVITWLTGYTGAGLAEAIADNRTLEGFFAQAPAPSPAADQVTGVICGYRVETIEDPVLRDCRRLDKVIDELAKGRPLTKIMRDL